MSIQQILLSQCMKPEEIAGDTEAKEQRINELIRWFARYATGHANSKWLHEHAFELAHYINERKNLE